jgi:hypothetical protein
LEKARSKVRAYALTEKGRAARKRADTKKYDKIRGPAFAPERRRMMLQHRYGITPEDYDELLARQGGHCVFCLGTPAEDRTGRLHIDHDHKRGVVRGLLCWRHNIALGYFGDSEEGLLFALKYVRGEL